MLLLRIRFYLSYELKANVFRSLGKFCAVHLMMPILMVKLRDCVPRFQEIFFFCDQNIMVRAVKRAKLGVNLQKASVQCASVPNRDLSDSTENQIID